MKQTTVPIEALSSVLHLKAVCVSRLYDMFVNRNGRDFKVKNTV